MINEYSFTELAEKALETNDPADVAALGEWFERYSDNRHWNGECWGFRYADRVYDLYPIYGEYDEEYDTYPTIGYEIR